MSHKIHTRSYFIDPVIFSSPLLSTGLECNHCGGFAIEHADNMYLDGEGTECAACGYPGHVVVDTEPGYDDEATATWYLRDGNDDVCREPGCEDCAEVRSQWPDVPSRGGAER